MFAPESSANRKKRRPAGRLSLDLGNGAETVIYLSRALYERDE